MDDLELQEKPGIFSKIAGLFTHQQDDEFEDDNSEPSRPRSLQLRTAYKHNVTVRRQVVSFDDAMAAANGLKRGEQQILNLAHTETVLRQKVVDFMCGVNFALEGSWEEVGDHIYLVVPASTFVEVAPPTARSNSFRN
jgi:cell division inhibitor SepF